MKLERRLMKENEAFRAPVEIEPRGVIIYSSGYPATTSFMLDTLNRETFRASVHALIDAEGIVETLPLNIRAEHSGTVTGNTHYLSVMVCEPTSKDPRELVELRDQTYNNLVQYLVFLCRYCQIDMNACSVIQLAGTANQNSLVTREVLKPCFHTKPFFGRIQVSGKSSDSEYCNERKLLTDLQNSLVQISELQEQVTTKFAENAVDAIGIGNVVLFLGGNMYKSRGISTRMNFSNRLAYGVVTDYSPKSKHVFEVTFPSGSTVWVNKSTVVRSTLGHVSY